MFFTCLRTHEGHLEDLRHERRHASEIPDHLRYEIYKIRTPLFFQRQKHVVAVAIVIWCIPSHIRCGCDDTRCNYITCAVLSMTHNGHDCDRAVFCTLRTLLHECFYAMTLGYRYTLRWAATYGDVNNGHANILISLLDLCIINSMHPALFS